MRYTGKIIPKNDNVPAKKPLLEFIKLVLILALAFAAVYFVLGLIADRLIKYVPPETEASMGAAQLHRLFKLDHELLPQDERIGAILAKLLPFHDARGLEYTARYDSRNELNAVSLMGGYIVVFERLYDNFRDEKELAFILGHELGHLARRDQLQRTGRILLAALASIAISGVDSGLTDFIITPITITNMKYTRDQEIAADLYGVDMLYKAYGTALPAIKVTEKMEALTAGNKKPVLIMLDNYPTLEARKAAIIKYSAEKSYKAD